MPPAVPSPPPGWASSMCVGVDGALYPLGHLEYQKGYSIGAANASQTCDSNQVRQAWMWARA